MTEEKTLGALEQTIHDQAESIFEEKLDKAMDRIQNDEDLKILEDLKVVVNGNTYDIAKFLLRERYKKQNFRFAMSIMGSSAYRKEEESLKQFKEEEINKIAMKLSDDFLEQYKKEGETQ